MKGLLFMLFIATGATAAAQLSDTDLKKIFEKNKRLLQKPNIQTPTLQLNRNDKAGVLSLRQDNMPCFVPDTRAIAAIPNAMPQLQIPAIAAIPNPALKRNLQLKSNADFDSK